MHPLTSVIVPAFNEADDLEQHLALLAKDLDERYGDRYELIVVDDGSTDATRDVLRRLRRVHPRLVIEEHERAAGFEAAIRTGVIMASGERLVILRDGLKTHARRQARSVFGLIRRLAQFFSSRV